MFCAQPITIKTCNSTDSTTTAATATCGTYTKRDLIVLQANTTCTATQIQLTTANEFGLGTASPFNLTLVEGSKLSAAILLLWCTALGIRYLKKMILGNEPE